MAAALLANHGRPPNYWSGEKNPWPNGQTHFRNPLARKSLIPATSNYPSESIDHRLVSSNPDPPASPAVTAWNFSAARCHPSLWSRTPQLPVTRETTAQIIPRRHWIASRQRRTVHYLISFHLVPMILVEADRFPKKVAGGYPVLSTGVKTHQVESVARWNDSLACPAAGKSRFLAMRPQPGTCRNHPAISPSVRRFAATASGRGCFPAGVLSASPCGLVVLSTEQNQPNPLRLSIDQETALCAGVLADFRQVMLRSIAADSAWPVAESSASLDQASASSAGYCF